jgi:outer membrane protein
MRPKTPMALLALATWLFAWESAAADPRPSDKSQDLQVANATLTLEAVLDRVQNYHPKLQGARVERAIASAKFLEKQGAFDPVLSAYAESLDFNSTSSRGKLNNAFQSNLSVEFPTRSGLKYYFGYQRNTGSVKSPLSATGEGGEFYSGFQFPLFRGAGNNEKVIAEQQAELGISLADTSIALTRLELLQKATSSYWEWVATTQRLKVARTLLALAQVRATAVQDRVKAGDLAAIDIVEARQEVQFRQGELVKAQRDQQKESLSLSQYLWNADGTSSPPPDPQQAPQQFPIPTPLANLVAQITPESILERRPELQRIALSNQVFSLDAALAQNQRLSGVDLYAVVGQDTGFNSVGATFKLGVRVSLPLAQRTADGLIEQAQGKIDKLALENLSERQRILIEVNDALQSVDAALGRYQAANQEVELANQLEQSERDRFTLGDSTLFLVNQRERSAAAARIKQIDAQALLEKAKGTFLAITNQF